MSEEYIKKVTAAANAVSESYDAAVYMYSGAIDEEGYGKLMSVMQQSNEKPFTRNAILFLTTSGGLATSAYKIARRLQEAYQKFYLVVPAYCKSAGTLVAIGAHELIMDDLAELGPLDVQLYQRDEIGKRKSGLLVRQSFQGLADETYDVFEKIMLEIKMQSSGQISFDAASRIASEIAARVMAPVYGQINPETLGNDLRDLEVAQAYGERLEHVSKNTKKGALRHLIHGYPSHDFIIDRSECKDLFSTVCQPNDDIQNLIELLARFVYAEQHPHLVCRWDEKSGEK